MTGFPSKVPGDHGIVLSAVRFAAQRHEGQARRYTGEPYLMHLLAVAYGVANRTMDPYVIAAAVLHDVLEDTLTEPAELQMLFGHRVADLVVELTDVYTSEAYPHLNRAKRKELEAERMGTTSAEAQLIKAYDLMDNTASIAKHDPGFAKVYLKEKRDLLLRLDKLDAHENLMLAAHLNG